ncbi:class II aaRS and biotin synthetase [Polyporus arcularius HHB13444]|uniref:Class II aaRS and biotin synthetase n=1 Tax=Polyporus arcularius HHB13444 TaxID=1314778 RepID=A0A5C3PJT5_9APHY|nr:class II aaRS and biotin synthetase [Polyporus arcularius HHB13444]
MNVLVYSGSDASPASHTNTLASLRSLLIPNYAVQPVTSQALSGHPWSATCALLVLPSFLSPGTTSSGSSTGSALSPAAVNEIQKYVASGGRVLSLGTPARVQSRKTNNSLSLSAQMAGMSILGLDRSKSQPESKLTLEDTESRLSLSLTPAAPSDSGEAADVQLTAADNTHIDGIPCTGVIDTSDAPDGAGVKILARLRTDADSPVGVQARIGRGNAAIWSLHLESPLSVADKDRTRLNILRQTLSDLGLAVPSQPSEAQTHARPTPQILTGAPWRAGVVSSILQALEVPSLETSEPYQLKDSNDTFLVHPPSSVARVFTEARDFVAKSSEDPSTWNAKHIVAYTAKGSLPPRELTPKFDIAAYYEALATARKDRGCPESYPQNEWGVGEALLYGEIVTSTQTMLDKNMRLLSSLPTPVLSLASAQLTGRGRGGNIWLSPPGCLQFSLLLRVPLSALPASKIVFVQYIFALAVAEACRSEQALGAEGERVRIKWPNDLYAITRDGEKKKIGGILVNTSFGAGQVELVVGCGLNVLNPPPIPSLTQLLPEDCTPPTMERTLAAIMARFERMWAEFLRERGSFGPFMDLYLDRWLHSDQLVTLTTVTPPRKVRIVGITPDHGLLRTLPEPDGTTSSYGADFIDLQPDGNSFDLMAGLIKTKT